MKKKLIHKTAIFLDRDGTIIKDQGYIKDIRKVSFYKNSIPALKMLQKYFSLFIVTNQSGISKGITSAKEVETVNRYIEQQLEKEKIEIIKTYTCPHDTKDNCKCKKPKPFFLNEAKKDFNINLKKSFVLGDHPHDVTFATNVGATGIYLLTGHGKKHFPQIDSDFIVAKNILDATKLILKKR